MDIESAGAKCRELVKLGLSPYRTKKTLEAAGFDRATVDKAIAEYRELYQAAKAQAKLAWRMVGISSFLCGSGLFIYFAFFFSSSTTVVAYPFLPLATWGLLKALLP